ncbi:hypothetical protein [Enemella dayhoffiae]|uniref:hypothetical protein n=1 Tax=Enemella dayhoffiae TaxID=2016507 RepID=UPI00113FFA80|nr:hypothetical protein [Enemella dayhoffiae]
MVTISRHVQVGRLDTWLCDNALAELGDARTPAPTEVDAAGRSAQRFVVEVLARSESCVSAPLMVTVARSLFARSAGLHGCRAPGEVVEAVTILTSMADWGLTCSTVEQPSNELTEEARKLADLRGP